MNKVMLTLNSIMFLLIQIPKKSKVEVLKNFKFHYVSINSFNNIGAVKIDTNFKFHYVSINSFL